MPPRTRIRSWRSRVATEPNDHERPGPQGRERTNTETPVPKQYPPRRVMFRFFGIAAHRPRSPRRYFNEASGGYPLYPLYILVALRLVEQLDYTAWGILGPDIRKYFGFSTGAFISLSGVTAIAGLVLTVPIAYYADRHSRAWIALVGALVW